MNRSRLVAVLCVATVWAVPSSSSAVLVHVVQPGDTVSRLSVEYYGGLDRAVLLRAVNRLPLDGPIELAAGEPMIIPESRRRVVVSGDTWETLAEIELGDTDRAWFLAEANGGDESTPVESGTILTVPYLLAMTVVEGLGSTIDRFYPQLSERQRLAQARTLVRLNPSLKGRMADGTRFVMPFPELSILPGKRAEVERSNRTARSLTEQRLQQEADTSLDRLPELLREAAYIEIVQRAGGLVLSTELTEAQRVTVHRFLGQAFLALERPDLAEQEFVGLLQLQRDFQFDQVTTSPTVLDLLEKARRSPQVRRPPSALPPDPPAAAPPPDSVE